MTPGLPPFNLSLGFEKKSASGGISAPNTVYFGGFGAGAGGGGLASVLANWPVLLGAAVLLVVLRKQ